MKGIDLEFETVSSGHFDGHYKCIGYYGSDHFNPKKKFQVIISYIHLILSTIEFKLFKKINIFLFFFFSAR